MMRMDERGQAHGIIMFVAMVVTGALLFILFQPAADAILNAMLDHASSQQAKDVISERQRIFGLILFYVLFLSGLTLIARAVFQSRSPG